MGEFFGGVIWFGMVVLQLAVLAFTLYMFARLVWANERTADRLEDLVREMRQRPQ